MLVDGRLARRRRTGVATYIGALRAALAEIDAPGVSVEWADGPPGLPRLGRLTSLGNLLLDLAWLHVAVPVRAWRRRAAVIHAPVNWAPWWSPCPIVVTVQDLTWERLPGAYTPGFRRYAGLFARRTARRAAAVIATSRATAADLVDLYGVRPERIAVVPLGVEVDTKPPAEREPVVLAVGVLHPRKRILPLVEGHARYWRAAADRPDRCRLVVAGAGGSDEEAVRAAAGPGCDVLGFVPREDLLDLYRRARLLVYPSAYEGFGLPVLEAMAHGCPALVARNSSLIEVGGDVALYLDDPSPAGIADALAAALADPADLDRRGAEGRERAAGYPWEAVARGTLDVYRRAIGG